MDPFRAHLVSLLSTYELGPLPGIPIPQYEGPNDWQTETILKSFTSLARRMCVAEERLRQLKYEGVIEESSGQQTLKMVTSSKKDHLSAPSANAVNMTISLDAHQAQAYTAAGPSSVTRGHDYSPATPTSHVHCPACGRPTTDPPMLPRYSDINPGSDILDAPMGPLTSATIESDMSVIEELKLMKAQAQDVVRVCNAVARGDLSQKITAQETGMSAEGDPTLEESVNFMVDHLSTIASEVTILALETGTQGRLGGQARVEGVEGTWADLTNNVNKMALTLTAQVRSIGSVTTAVALGEPVKFINIEARGEILDMKSTVNEMVDRLARSRRRPMVLAWKPLT